MKKIIFLQPCVAEYRRGFFEGIAESGQLFVKILAARRDSAGIKSIFLRKENLSTNLSLREYSFFNGRIVWQSGVRVYDIKAADYLVVTGNPRYVSNLFILFLCKLFRTKVIWWGQGWSSGSNNLSYNIKMFISYFFDGYLFYTDDELKKARSSLFFNKNSSALNNGLNLSIIDNAIKIRSNSLGFTCFDGIHLVFIGRLTKKSGIIKVIQATLKLSIPFHLSIIGDGELLNEAKSIVGDCPFYTFHGALYDETEISKVMLSSDVFVYGGAVGLSLVHAFCYSLPAIIHDDFLTHMPESNTFLKGKTGFTFKKGCENSLVEAINKAYHKKKLSQLKSMGKEGRKIIEQNYTTNVMAARFLDFIDNGN